MLGQTAGDACKFENPRASLFVTLKNAEEANLKNRQHRPLAYCEKVRSKRGSMLAVLKFESIAPIELAQTGVVQKGSFDRMSVLGGKRVSLYLCQHRPLAGCFKMLAKKGFNAGIWECESTVPWWC